MPQEPYIHTTYNSILEDVKFCDIVIGFSAGEATFLKNRRGENMGKLSIRHSVEVLVNTLFVSTDIEFFDDAARIDLVNEIVKVLKRHRVINFPQEEGIKKVCIDNYIGDMLGDML
jgi:hypothetical protein